MKHSEFRVWVENFWHENCIENRYWKDTEYTLEEYFQKYKYWLKREYRFQQREQAILNEK
jgi:hypothetical protein